MTEEQLAEIEQRWWNPFRLGDLPKNGLDDVSDLLAEVRLLQEKLHYEETCHAEAQEEVRRLNRMVDKAIDKLADFGCVVDTDPCPANYIEVGCRGCVIKYLESEVADK